MFATSAAFRADEYVASISLLIVSRTLRTQVGLPGARLPLYNHWFAGASNIDKNLAEVRWRHESELGYTFGDEYLFNKAAGHLLVSLRNILEECSPGFVGASLIFIRPLRPLFWTETAPPTPERKKPKFH